MVEVVSFYNEERGVWAGIVAGHPETNASGETKDQMLGYMVIAWNRDNPSAKVTGPDAFDVRATQVPDRPDWA